ncbi:hypothetical protein [Janibacter limosus]|uniref:Glycoside hydrolase family 15 n=1 Tax=Janibacter limosus TaxID=53458 RepID=A0A4P6MZ81_9MICO|nr:hypothetical protein [Janibacter limosus]QBF47405.1 hypothetical protein EXU32_14800 [Janibacter limosus]
MIDRLPGATSRRTFVAGAVAAVAAGATSTMGMSLYRNRHEVPASYGLTVAMRSATGPWRQTRELVHAADLERVIPGTRVLAGPQQEELLATQEAWLDGLDLPDHVAGTPRDLVRQAALDLWVLSAGLPMAVAGWSPMWRHAWPRDTAHVAVALHRLGDAKGATRQLAALASRVGRAGRMQARYALDGGTPDDRPPQDDGFGWALWAAGSTVDSWRGTADEASIDALVRHCATTALTRLGSDGLPLPSPDYWELEERQLTLGTAAPLLAGLEHAALLTTGGLRERCAAAALRLDHQVHSTFGMRGWPRRVSGGASDTAIAWMLPPYRVGPPREAELRAALDEAARQMARPNGGYAPGGDWRRDGVAWTPETAVLAGAWATADDTRGRAVETLDWLGRHRSRGRPPSWSRPPPIWDAERTRPQEEP